MQEKTARELRESWSDKDCVHPGYDKEYDLGADTGDFVCIQCGEYLTKAEIEEIDSVKKKSE
ncbi:hypothetical protein D3C87_12500 [compost metagenome]